MGSVAGSKALRRAVSLLLLEFVVAAAGCKPGGTGGDAATDAGTGGTDGAADGGGGSDAAPLAADGEPCAVPADCASGYCEGGLCCASGDCCATVADCPSGGGIGAVCDDAATCQGTRGKVVCASFVCGSVSGIDDDTACDATTMALDCALYAPVYCTGAADQPAPACPGSCAADTDCVAGAHCEGLACVDDRAAGGGCARPEECETGLFCVDGTCCATACAGACVACALAGSEGTCAPFAAATDPDLECGGFSCGGYFVGFDAARGDMCYARADVTDAGATCDGGGACVDAAAVCPTQPDGPLQIDCDDTCQTPTAGTCTGTVAGACTDLPPGAQTCGTGACEVTVPLCSGGAPVACVPGTPGTESCNGIDDDCEGGVDEDVPGCTPLSPAASCLDVYDSGASVGDGIYWIQIGAGAPFEVQCLMSADGGGWTLVANFPWPGDTAGVAGWTSGAAVGTSFSDTSSPFKLSDADINALRTDAFRGHGTATVCLDPSTATTGPCAIDTLLFWDAGCAYASGASSAACATAYYDAALTMPTGATSPCAWHYGLTSVVCGGGVSTFGSSHIGDHVFVGEYLTTIHAYDGRSTEDPTIQVWVR